MSTTTAVTAFIAIISWAMASARPLTPSLLAEGVNASGQGVKQYRCLKDQDASYDLTFFAIGDWGRQGNENQRRAAKMMSDVAACMSPRFIISTGDNFYDYGLKSTSDPAFKQTFVDVYDSANLQVKWYAVLGNHDYGQGIDPNNSTCAAQRLKDCPEGCCYSPVWQYTRRMNDARWNCQNGVFQVPTGSKGLVDIIMMDTNPFIQKYRNTSWYYNAGGLWLQNPDTIKAQLRTRLAASTARWKFVVGHHPIASYADSCKYSNEKDCLDMQWLEPELKANGVAAYLCGHEHLMEYIYKPQNPAVPDSPPSRPVYVVSGAGSDIDSWDKSKYQPKADYKLDYLGLDQGFVAVRVNSTHTVMYYYASAKAKPAHTVILTNKS